VVDKFVRSGEGFQFRGVEAAREQVSGGEAGRTTTTGHPLLEESGPDSGPEGGATKVAIFCCSETPHVRQKWADCGSDPAVLKQFWWNSHVVLAGDAPEFQSRLFASEGSFS
jgi:hypothetical protein